jgi:hypothetical protein
MILLTSTKQSTRTQVMGPVMTGSDNTSQMRCFIAKLYLQGAVGLGLHCGWLILTRFASEL